MSNITNYNGRPVLVLNPSSERPFQFGLLKAKAILLKVKEIKGFATGEMDLDLLDISPPVNKFDKFMITQAQAGLIVDCLPEIIKFVEDTEINDRVKYLKEKEKPLMSGGKYRK